MNVNPKAIRILCYGDSNTWGYMPGSKDRYGASIRWTTVLQKRLGEKFEIIEEGLSSRTTNLDDPKYEGRNGATYLKSCLKTHSPLALVILMLGTNDLKERFERTPEQIALGIDKLLVIINDSKHIDNQHPKVLLLSPPLIDESVGDAGEKFPKAAIKSKQLGRLYKVVATKYRAAFVDIAQHVSPSRIDGYHLDPDAHKKIAKILVEKIRGMALTSLV